MHTPRGVGWNTIRKIKAKSTAEGCKDLELGNYTFADREEVSSIIGQTLSGGSSRESMGPKFAAYRNTREGSSLNFTSANKEC